MGLIGCDIMVSDSKPINKWVEDIHEYAKDKGWWDTDREFPEICATIHSEVSEAFEEARNGNMHVYYDELSKPEGVPIELVDAMIRIMDYFGHMGWDMDELLRFKYEYNLTRDYRHGGKKY